MPHTFVGVRHFAFRFCGVLKKKQKTPSLRKMPLVLWCAISMWLMEGVVYLA